MSYYDWSDDAAHGTRLSSNEQYAIYARNYNSSYLIIFRALNDLYSCIVDYPDENYYVYSVAAIKHPNGTDSNDTLTFVQVAEYTKSNFSAYLTVAIVKIFHDENCRINFYHTTIWNYTHQEYMQIKIDPQNRYAYIFADTFLLSFDINNKSINQLITTDSFQQPYIYMTRAFDVTDTWAIAAGLKISARSLVSTVFLIRLQPSFLFILDTDDTDEFDEISYTTIYNRMNDMSVSINQIQNQVLIGKPAINQVTLAAISAEDTNISKWKIEIIQKMIWTAANTGFGRTVNWLDNHRIIVNGFSVPNRPWSRSELLVFNINNSMTVPLFVFPNNQQILAFHRLPMFLNFIIFAGNILILTEQKVLIFLSLSPPGYVSRLTPNTNISQVIHLKPVPCIPGSFSNESTIGPCIVCPPHTKNPAYVEARSNVKCIPCESSSFCPLGSIDDVSISYLTSHTQSYSFPDTPDINNYDDLLLQTMFTFPTKSTCIIKTPLLWMLIAIGFCFLIWISVALLKYMKLQHWNSRRKYVKTFFKRTDIIGEGELWIGGLFSFAIFVIIGFSYWFAASYIDLYPFETPRIMHAACDETIRNVQFDNALQLPLPSANGEEWPIFNMLENQPLTLAIDLINTHADCSSITAQLNRLDAKYLHLPIKTCSPNPLNNVTLSFALHLARYTGIIQLNISAMYFIGGIRLCLRGPSEVNNSNILQSLDTCQFYFTENQTLGLDVTLPILLIQTINQTKPLRNGDETLYHGRWAVTWDAPRALSNKMIYEQYGEYLRYTSNLTVITITMAKQPFFLQNNQQPIIRKAELAFHTLFFTTIVLELFSLVFLITKLAVLPIIHKISSLMLDFHRSNSLDSKAKETLHHYETTNDQSMGNEVKLVAVNTK